MIAKNEPISVFHCARDEAMHTHSPMNRLWFHPYSILSLSCFESQKDLFLINSSLPMSMVKVIVKEVQPVKLTLVLKREE